MIERTHFEAYRTAAKRAAKAAEEGNFDKAEVSERQIAAIRELEVHRKEIFAKYNVTDVEQELPDVDLFKIRVRNPWITDEYESLLKIEFQPEKIKELSLNQLLVLFRVKAFLTQDQFAHKIGRSMRSVQRWEKAQVSPRPGQIFLAIRAFGWDNDDWRAQLLLQKAQEARNTPAQR